MATTQKSYGELVNGDLVWIEGYLFEVRNVRIASRKGERATMHSEPNRADVIRFEGVLTEQGPQDIRHTGYNGAVYGGYADVPCTVEGGA